MAQTTDVIFHEQQQFRQWWLWALVLGDVLLMLGLLGYFTFGPVGANMARSGRIGLLVAFGAATLFSTALVALLAGSRLITEVRPDGLYIRFVPFHRSARKVPLENVVKVEARTYSPIGQYGGYGLRRTFRGRAYNVSGNRGVRLDFADGKHLLIGSQQPNELAQAIQTIRPQQ